MLNDPLYRLFPQNLSDESVDLLFTLLTELTDLCFQAYAQQIVRIAQEDNPPTIAPDEPPDLDDCGLDDEIPF